TNDASSRAGFAGRFNARSLRSRAVGCRSCEASTWSGEICRDQKIKATLARRGVCKFLDARVAGSTVEVSQFLRIGDGMAQRLRILPRADGRKRRQRSVGQMAARAAADRFSAGMA